MNVLAAPKRQTHTKTTMANLTQSFRFEPKHALVLRSNYQQDGHVGFRFSVDLGCLWPIPCSFVDPQLTIPC